MSNLTIIEKSQKTLTQVFNLNIKDKETAIANITLANKFNNFSRWIRAKQFNLASQFLKNSELVELVKDSQGRSQTMEDIRLGKYINAFLVNNSTITTTIFAIKVEEDTHDFTNYTTFAYYVSYLEKVAKDFIKTLTDKEKLTLLEKYKVNNINEIEFEYIKEFAFNQLSQNLRYFDLSQKELKDILTGKDLTEETATEETTTEETATEETATEETATEETATEETANIIAIKLLKDIIKDNTLSLEDIAIQFAKSVKEYLA